MTRGQASLEYLLLLGGAILLASTTITMLASGTSYPQKSANIFKEKFEELESIVSQTQGGLSSYSEKEAFLVSDSDWRTALRLVPLTIWAKSNESCLTVNHFGEKCAYPLLVFHDEGASTDPNRAFDVDSIIYFLQQFQPTRLTIFVNDLSAGDVTPTELDSLLVASPPTGAGLSGKVQVTDLSNYFSYWNDWSEVVVVDYDNYDSALMASVFASYKNTPLLLVNDSQFSPTEQAAIDGRKVFVVGSVSSSVNSYINNNASSREDLTKEQLEERFVSLTGTNRVIFTKSNDLTNPIVKSFKPDKSSQNVSNLYYKTSLFSPILAAGKNEVILTTQDAPENYQAMADSLHSRIKQLVSMPGEIDCNAGDACSPFQPTPIAVNWVQDSLEFTLNVSGIQHQGSTQNYHYYYRFPFRTPFTFPGYFFECAGGTTGLNIYINDGYGGAYELVASYTGVPCRATPEDGDFVDPSKTHELKGSPVYLRNDEGYAPDSTIYNPTFLLFSANNLNHNGSYQVRFDFPNAKMAVPDRIELYEIAFDETGPASEQVVGDCGEFDGCFPSLNQSTFNEHSKSSSEQPIYFSLSGLTPGKSAWATFEVAFEHASGALEFWVGTNNVAGFSASSASGSSFYIPASLVSNPLQLEPRFIPSEGTKDYLIKSLSLVPESEDGFLTIMSPITSIRGTAFKPSHGGKAESLDSLLYGKVNGTTVNFAVGRIFGVTSSDVSAYIARSLFIGELQKDRKALLYLRGTNESATREEAINSFIPSQWPNEVNSQFLEAPTYGGYAETQNNPSLISDYYDSDLVEYIGHASFYGWQSPPSSHLFIDNQVYLNPLTVVDYGCSTCALEEVLPDDPSFNDTFKLFCAQHLKRGAMAFIGTYSTVPGHGMLGFLLNELYLNGKTTGEAHQRAANEAIATGSSDYPKYYNLIGDPTYRPRWW